MNKAIVTVVGQDKVGLIAKVSTTLMNHNVNILDLAQNVLEQIFTMTMIVDISQLASGFEALSDELGELSEQLNVEIRLQREEIFTAMHRI